MNKAFWERVEGKGPRRGGETLVVRGSDDCAEKGCGPEGIRGGARGLKGVRKCVWGPYGTGRDRGRIGLSHQHSKWNGRMSRGAVWTMWAVRPVLREIGNTSRTAIALAPYHRLFLSRLRSFHTRLDLDRGSPSRHRHTSADGLAPQSNHYLSFPCSDSTLPISLPPSLPQPTSTSPSNCKLHNSKA